MTDKVGEQLSAWMDGELPHEEVPLLLKRLEEDRDLRLRLQRFQLIRDAMKGGLPELVNYRMADRVDEEIRNEPAVVAEQLDVESARGRSWLKTVTGAGIAAAVAIIAVVGVQLVNETTTPPAVAPQAAVEPAVVVPQAMIQRAGVNRWQVSDPEVARRLNDYLAKHSERATSAGMQGVSPHVRIVGYEQSE